MKTELMQPPRPMPPYVCKTAHTKWEKKISWKVAKGVQDRYGEFVNRVHVNLFEGDSYWATYGIRVVKEVTDVYTAGGQIEIRFPSRANGVLPVPMVSLEINDAISSIMPPGRYGPIPPTILKCFVDGAWRNVPHRVRPEGTLICGYRAEVPDSGRGKNVVWVTVGGAGTTPVHAQKGFRFWPSQVYYTGPQSVYLRDPDDPDKPRRLDGSGHFKYEKHFDCTEAPYTHKNRVSIVPILRATGGAGAASADVTVADRIGHADAYVHIKCFGLDVTKTAKPKFDRTHEWTIDKYASHGRVVLARLVNAKKGEKWVSKYARSAKVKYTVEVDSDYRDHDFRASGKIEITNNHPKRPAHILKLRDVIKIDPPGDNIQVDKVRCEDEKGDEVKFPTYLDAGATLTCHWRSLLPDNAERKNVARVELQNYHYRVVGNEKDGWKIEKTAELHTTWFRAHAAIVFGDTPKNRATSRHNQEQDVCWLDTHARVARGPGGGLRVESFVMHDLTPAYALDALDDQERREYEEHLRTCAQCQEELAGLRDTAASLAYATPAPEPPSALRERLLAGLEEQELATVLPLRRRRPVQVLGAATALAAAAAIALGIWAGSLSSSLDDERVAAAEQTEVLDVLSASDAVRVPLEGASGSLVVAADGRGVLLFSTLDAAPAGQTYEAWVIRDGIARPAGLFAGSDGTVVRLTESVPAGATVAVTVEEESGVDQPTSDPLFLASVA